MARAPNTIRSLDQLEGSHWPPAPEDATPMMVRCHALRTVPIGELTPGDIRMLIGQGIGTEYLMPLALDLLSDDALTEGDYYPGDLLNAAMSTEPAFWAHHSTDKARLNRIASALKRELVASETARRKHRQLLKDIERFLAGAA